MFTVSVLPLTRTFAKGAGAETLTYFSGTDIEPGTIVKVPLRARTVRALVVETHPAEKARMEIRSGPFALKKITGAAGKMCVSRAFLRAADAFSEYSAQSTASILSVLLPQAVLEAKRNVVPIEPKCTLVADVSAFQAGSEERFAEYRSLIRETFARKRSFFFLVPTAEDAEYAYKELSRGIEEFTVVFPAPRNAKELTKRLKIVDDPTHPALIIATPPYLCLMREDTETVLCERENSRAYNTLSRPFLDFRAFAKMLAHEYCARIIYGSEILRVETLYKVKENEYNEWGHMNMRSPTTADVSISSMVRQEGDEEGFKIFSNRLERTIISAVEAGKRVFLFGARKGLAPLTVCSDCEMVVSCPVCGAPLVLHESANHFFLCHKCGEKRPAKDECSHCGGWRLATLGIGVETIEKELRRIIPHPFIFHLNKDAAPTPAKAMRTADDFLHTRGGILIGTEMALRYVRSPVEVAAVVSADSLIGMPDFRVNERLLSILTSIRALGREKVIFQTRSPENPVFSAAAEGNFLPFFEREIDERRKFAFPPFSLFIKIAWEGSPSRAAKDSELVRELFGETVHIVKVRAGGRLHRFHGLIKIEVPNEWPDKTTVMRLMSLPPQFAVSVDPEDLL